MSRDAPGKALFALLGDPVHHSLSPAIQNAAFQAADVQAVYTALRTFDALVCPLMRALARDGGGGNVTLPHKTRAAECLDETSPAVRATGACNCFWWEDGRGLCGDNTDVDAFRAAAERTLGGSLAGRAVLVVGAGGAARAAVHACVSAGAERVEILNRTRARAERLIRDLGSPPPARLLSGGDAEASAGYDLAVNATSLGLARDDPLPLDPSRLNADALLDLVYGEAETALVQAARAAGWKAEDGRRMLVDQAAASFRCWFGREAPYEAMCRAAGLSG